MPAEHSRLRKCRGTSHASRDDFGVTLDLDGAWAKSYIAQPPMVETMRHLTTSIGLPRLDRASWNKGFADGFHGRVWWPGVGTEPLSYAAGYTEAQTERRPGDEPRPWLPPIGVDE